MPFLVFEGIDASGKSTLIQALEKELQQRKIKPVVTKEPGGSALGLKIRSLLIEKSSQPPSPHAEVLLYFADRSQHIQEVIKPALEREAWLISDRYWASTFAYQCGGRKMDEEWVLSLKKSTCPDSCEPDLWILLDLPVESSLDRLQTTRTHRDRFELEKKEFHQGVRDYYLKLSQQSPDSWLVLDALQPPQKLLEKILVTLKEKNILK